MSNPTLDTLPEVLTLRQVADYLRLSPKTVAKRLLISGLLRGRLDVQKWLITKAALVEYLEGKEKK